MVYNEEIKYDFTKIEDAVKALRELQNRAVTCSNMKLNMSHSKGDSKTVLLNAHKAVADVAASVAIMLGNAIEDIDYAKTSMKQEDESIAGKMGAK